MISHTHQVRVYFEDTDAGGIMYHAAYLGFAERARTEALRDCGLPHAEMVFSHGVMFVVRRVKVEYLRPARLDDLLTIRTETHPEADAKAGATITLKQIFSLEGSAIAELDVVLVCVRAGTGKPARIPPKWRTVLARSPGSAMALAGNDRITPENLV